ncbi:MAG TPA: YciI family protein, partial [Microthrixaceae bacterium]|nr:YciI family protein [Microthrixaceae bacterium]
GNEELWGSFPPKERAELIKATDAHNKAMTESGELLYACGVGEPVTNRQVTVDSGGTPVITDGPYIETKEYLGSFYIVDCASLDRALELAAAMPSATFTQVEVKPILHGGSADDL